MLGPYCAEARVSPLGKSARVSARTSWTGFDFYLIFSHLQTNAGQIKLLNPFSSASRGLREILLTVLASTWREQNGLVRLLNHHQRFARPDQVDLHSFCHSFLVGSSFYALVP